MTEEKTNGSTRPAAKVHVHDDVDDYDEIINLYSGYNNINKTNSTSGKIVHRTFFPNSNY